MDDKIIIALIGLASAVVGGLIASWANWGVEKRKQKLAYRKELIASWRKMIVDVAEHQRYLNRRGLSPDTEVLAEGNYFWQTLESKPEWHSLRPHLDINTLRRINKTIESVHSHEIDSIVQEIIDQVFALEKKWGLI